MKLLFMQFLLLLSHLGPNILLSNLFSATLNMCSRRMKDEVSHSQKEASEITVFYI
jgi:hypothetical protein